MVTKTGNQNDNTLIGTSLNDFLFGLGGDDTLQGRAGDDVLIGGRDDDRANGGAGNDRTVWNEGDGNDVINGGADFDTAEINYFGTVSLVQQGNKAFFERESPQTFNLTLNNVERVEANGSRGVDSLTIGDLSDTDIVEVAFFAGGGNDRLDARRTSVAIIVDGGAGRDRLRTGRGDDTISSGKGTDQVNAGAGNDRVIWNEGDGDDVINAGGDIDIVEENFSGAVELLKSGDKVTFGRTGTNPFTMTIDNAELFEINGADSNDTLTIGDLSGTDVTLITFEGGTGNDILDARATAVPVIADGGAGDDILVGGTGTTTSATGAVTGDDLTGGDGSDLFYFVNDPFTGGTPGQNLARPDLIRDFTTEADQFAFSEQVFDLDALTLQVGNSGALLGNSNIVVLTNGFANAGQASQAIAGNNNITAEKGLFIYFNLSLGFSRLVYSTNLAEGGPFSVLANLTSRTNIADQANFSLSNFALL